MLNKGNWPVKYTLISMLMFNTQQYVYHKTCYKYIYVSKLLCKGHVLSQSCYYFKYLPANIS